MASPAASLVGAILGALPAILGALGKLIRPNRESKPNPIRPTKKPEPSKRAALALVLIPLLGACNGGCAHLQKVDVACDHLHRIGVVIDEALAEDSPARDKVKQAFDPAHAFCFGESQ